MSETTRRGVLAGAAGIAAVSALSACGGGSSNNTTGSSGSSGGGATTGAATTPGAATTSAGANSGSGAIAQKSDIPLGGGKIFATKDLVITQPTSGDFKGFSATCTHMGCTVATVENGTIDCPCHGSKYSVTDGSVKNGPAPRPLAPKQLKIEGDSISLA
jgi:Rieske Fe-S protein